MATSKPKEDPTEVRAQVARMVEELRSHVERCRGELATAEQMFARAKELEATRS